MPSVNVCFNSCVEMQQALYSNEGGFLKWNTHLSADLPKTSLKWDSATKERKNYPAEFQQLTFTCALK